MSNALALAGVTAVLQYYFHNLYLEPSVADNFSSPVTVSCLAPDQIQNQIIGGAGAADAENQVNLFLHQVTHNAAWRNADIASMSSNGRNRLSNPPLALNLHYLLTVYGSDYWQAEALLGYALMMLHEAPVLTRNDIVTAMANLNPPLPQTPPYPSNKLNKYLGAAGLSDQIEMIKITPESMSREELAWLWTALKADYRPTFPFQVSVVLMQPELGSSLALPVLRRVFTESPMQPPQILAVQTKSGQLGAQPGELVTVVGEFLTGATRVSLTNTHLAQALTIPATNVTGASLTFTLPNVSPTEYPAGAYGLQVQFMDATGQIALQSSNIVPFAIAPILPAAQTLVSAPSGNGTLVTLGNFTPYAWPGQTIQLALSTTATPLLSVSAQSEPITGNGPVASLKFQFDVVLPTGVQLLARMLVDGVTSVVTADLVGVAPDYMPSFTGPWVTL